MRSVDAYNEEEQLAGFLVGADEALQPGQPAWSQVGIMLLRGVDRDTAC
jgi:hypothetical protein